MKLFDFFNHFKKESSNKGDVLLLEPEKNIDETDDDFIKLKSELVGQLSALHNSAIVSETDLVGDIIFANDIFCEYSKYTLDELLGNNHRMLKSGHQPFQKTKQTYTFEDYLISCLLDQL